MILLTEAGIPRDLFLQVQEEMVRRARLETGTGKRRVYSGKYALSHLVYCAHCGDIYRRTQWWIRGEKIPVWRCISRIEKRKANVDCPSRTIYEKDMHAAVVTTFNQLIAQEDELLPGMKLAMERAMANLTVKPDFAVIDGNREKDFGLPVKTIVKGDSLSANIAAASVIAKVTRDEWMEEIAKQYPQYGFEIHKGYGTKAHYAALTEHGPSPIHRMTFLKKFYGNK